MVQRYFFFVSLSLFIVIVWRVPRVSPGPFRLCIYMYRYMFYIWTGAMVVQYWGVGIMLRIEWGMDWQQMLCMVWLTLVITSDDVPSTILYPECKGRVSSSSSLLLAPCRTFHTPAAMLGTCSHTNFKQQPRGH